MIADTIAVSNDVPIYVVAVLGFLATMSSPIVAARYIARSNRKAAEDAAKIASAAASAAAIKAAAAASSAQAAAVTANHATAAAAAKLDENSAIVAAKLDSIQAVADGTHVIVNSQHTALLGTVASLARIIAHENPTDLDAQATAVNAEDAFNKSKAAADALTGTQVDQAAKDAITKNTGGAGGNP